MATIHIVILVASAASVFGIFLLGKIMDRCGAETPVSPSRIPDGERADSASGLRKMI